MIFFSKTETASTQTADALLCLMPPIFGQMLAGKVLCEIAQVPEA